MNKTAREPTVVDSHLADGAEQAHVVVLIIRQHRRHHPVHQHVSAALSHFFVPSIRDGSRLVHRHLSRALPPAPPLERSAPRTPRARLRTRAARPTPDPRRRRSSATTTNANRRSGVHVRRHDPRVDAERAFSESPRSIVPYRTLQRPHDDDERRARRETERETRRSTTPRHGGRHARRATRGAVLSSQDERMNDDATKTTRSAR